MVKKTYESEQITVQWDSSRCIHAAIWLRSLPEVFDVNRRPWIVLEGASAEAVAEAVMKCPSRALKVQLACHLGARRRTGNHAQVLAYSRGIGRTGSIT
jgi:uncharacterized Fe-S cluster protein YjdI